MGVGAESGGRANPRSFLCLPHVTYVAPKREATGSSGRTEREGRPSGERATADGHGRKDVPSGTDPRGHRPAPDVVFTFFFVCFKFPFGLLLGEMAGQACAACVSSLRVPVPQARASTLGLLAAL